MAEKLTPEQEAELIGRLEAVRADVRARYPERPIPNQLTPKRLEETPDDELEDLISRFVLSKMPPDLMGGDYGWLEALPRPLQTAYCSLVVEGELDNGGFNQFFFNGTDALSPGAIDFFEAIGAQPFAKVIREALDRAARRGGEVARSWGQGSMDEFMGSYGEEIFRDLDDQFYALYSEVDPSPLRIRWLRAHASEVSTSPEV